MAGSAEGPRNSAESSACLGPRDATSRTYASATAYVAGEFSRLGYHVRRQELPVPAGTSWGIRVPGGTSANVMVALDRVGVGVSAVLAATFMGHGLLDELRIYVHPVLIGRGRPLFPESDVKTSLRLEETRTFGSGVVLLRYALR